MRPSTPGRRAALMLCAIAALAAAGCGTDAGGGSGTQADDVGTTSTESAAKRPKGTPFKILAETPVGSPLGSFPGEWAAAQAAAKAINESGGVNGHPIEIIKCNNKLTPNGAAACARQAASEKAAAVVGQQTFTSVSYPILDKAGVPSFYWPIFPIDVSSPTNHPITGGGSVELFSLAWAAQKAGAKTIAFMTLQLPGFDVVESNAAAVAEKAGLTVVGKVPVSATATSFAAPVQQVRSSNPDAVGLLLASPQISGVIKAAQAQGWSPIWASDLGTFNPTTLEAAGKLTDDLWLVSAQPPATAVDQFPAIARFGEEMDAAGAAGVSDTEMEDRDEGATFTWLTVHALADVAESIKGDITAASLTKAVERAEDVDVQGLFKWSPSSPGLGKYVGIKDDGPLYYGRVEDGVYTPSSETIPTLEGVTLE